MCFTLHLRCDSRCSEVRFVLTNTILRSQATPVVYRLQTNILTFFIFPLTIIWCGLSFLMGQGRFKVFGASVNIDPVTTREPTIPFSSLNRPARWLFRAYSRLFPSLTFFSHSYPPKSMDDGHVSPDHGYLPWRLVNYYLLQTRP